MCSSYPTGVFLGSASPCTGSLCLSAKSSKLSFKSNIIQTSNARSSPGQSIPRFMRVASSSNRRGGFTKYGRACATVFAQARGDGESGLHWRKKSESSELGQSSSPSLKKRRIEKGSAHSHSQKGGTARKVDPNAKRWNGASRSKSLLPERVISYRNTSSTSESGDTISSVNGPTKKPPKIREQIRILSPLNKSPRVAILGGGMSGLVCALTLQEKGIFSTIFDTGKHGLGGRMGTRHVAQVNGDQLIFDHAAQYFTATDPRFQRLVDVWIAEGAVKEWKGIVGTLENGGKFSELQSGTKYIATNGMRLLADHLLSKRQLIEVRRPVWISRLMEADGIWHLNEYEKDHGDFDIVVIAHNGKCANRLLGPIGVPLVAKQMKRLDLSSIWALMAAFECPLPSVSSSIGKVQFEGAFVTGVDALSWMGDNTAKLQPQQSGGPHCWTFLSTAKFGKKNKVPQESIPTARAERVKREMLKGVEKALGLEEGLLPAPLYMKVQLWGAANPLNTPSVPCIFDAYGRVGICGDWLLGSNLEAAALSGMAMANQIFAFSEKKGLSPDEFCMGLEEPLFPLEGHDIGQFAGLACEFVRELVTTV